MAQNPNHEIKQKLLIIPIIAIAAVAFVTSLAVTIILTSYTETEISAGGYLYLAAATLAITVLFSVFTVTVMQKTFVSRLDKVQNGLFDFFDYLTGKQEKISYIDANTGAISRAINQKIEEIEKGLLKDKAFLQDFIQHASAIKQGDYSQRIETIPNHPILQKAYTGINDMLEGLEKNIGKDLREILHIIDNYASEDYRKNIQNPKGAVEIAINKLGEEISQILQTDKKHGLSFREKASTVNQNIHTAYENIHNNLNNELQTIVRTVDKVTQHIKQNVESASFISSYSQSVTDAAKEGQALAEKTAEAISQISEQVSTIDDAITIIDKITMQTNILSLNAAVEASTAGESGKGFAVVAQEVRNLATQTAKASKEIKSVVDTAKSKAAYGNEISSSMITGYNHLVEQVSKTMELVYNITQTSNLQDEDIHKIHYLVNEMQKHIDDSLSELQNAQKYSEENFQKAQQIVRQIEEKKLSETVSS